MIKKFILIPGLLWILAGNSLFSQSKLEIKNMFYEAESWILFEDYKEALPIYLRLSKIYPNNANFKYRIGQCYINTSGEKEKAVSYLEDAVKSINPEYKEGKFSETKAPYDAYYYLANAYRINNQIDKALETYKLFRKNLNPVIYDSTIVNFQIQSCLNAKVLMGEPLFIREKLLGSSINEKNSEFNPVVSDNEDMIIFARSEAFYDAILYSVKSNGVWSGAQNMNELFKVDRDMFPTSLSKDGKTLYLYSSANYDGIIFSSNYVNGSWTLPVKLNDNINTKYWESHATISHDNKKLYFTSNRKGTYGGLDIYVSRRDSTGNWGPAENLGPVINTPYNEETPFLSQDDKTLFFSSRGHFNMGGYDIFYSTLLDNGKMSVPLNAGYPLNSTDDDVFFKPLRDGYEGYVAKEGKGGFGKQDIYRIEIFSDAHPRKFLVKGFVKAADLMSAFDDSIRISAMNIKNPEQVVVVYSNPSTGEYELTLPQGNYKVTYEGDGIGKMTRDIDLPLTYSSDSFVLPGTILPKTDFTADLSIGTSRTITVSKGDSLLFPVKVEPNSMLRIEHWAGDSLLYSENITMKDSLYNFKTAPAPGDNRIVFTLTDRFNNKATSEVFITRENEKQLLIRPEYSHVIAQKQIDTFMSMLKNRSNGELKRLMNETDFRKYKFGNVDDVLSFIKEEGEKRNIPADEVDKAALRVAVMDNVLTQAAVDFIEKNSTGEIKQLLSGINIYESGLQTWTDLQEYIREKSGGKITPENLNEIAAAILSDSDPAISVLREKVLAYADHSEAGPVIRSSVSITDKQQIKRREGWLSSFADEALKQGMSQKELAKLLASISNLPGADATQLLNDLIKVAEEPLLSSLKSLDINKENIHSSEDLIYFLLTNKDKARFPQELVYKALSDIIAKKDIPVDQIGYLIEPERKFSWWILIIAAGALLTVIVLIGRRKKNKKKENHLPKTNND
ncbi:MAG TPA: tetratricopeptide repeat protein [Bacteroidales bacterium]|nr:tetratricopeptide repeat protein [Bacteroidales bacterium]